MPNIRHDLSERDKEHIEAFLFDSPYNPYKNLKSLNTYFVLNKEKYFLFTDGFGFKDGVIFMNYNPLRILAYSETFIDEDII